MGLGPRIWAALAREAALFAERCDITEELTRLQSHLHQFVELCEREEPTGRTLDFLSQALLREANTIGSKRNDATLPRPGVEMKTLIDPTTAQCPHGHAPSRRRRKRGRASGGGAARPFDWASSSLKVIAAPPLLLRPLFLRCSVAPSPGCAVRHGPRAAHGRRSRGWPARRAHSRRRSRPSSPA